MSDQLTGDTVGRLRTALAEVKEKSTLFKVLGAYPKAVL